MKQKFLTFAALAACISIASCEKLEMNAPEKEASPVIITDGEGHMVFKAWFGDEDKTKTQRESDGNVTWYKDDLFSVFIGGQASQTAGGYKYTNSAEAGSLATLSGSAPVGKDSYIALYPYDSKATSNGTTVTTTLPSNQVAKANTFADDLFITMGQATNTSDIAFYNLCGGVKFKVPVSNVVKVELISVAGEKIAGTVTASFDEDGKPKVDGVTNGSSVISLLPPAGSKYFNTTDFYYFVALPVTFDGGFKLKFIKENEYNISNNWQKSYSEKYAIRRGVFGTMTNIKMNETVSAIYFPDPKFKAAVLEVMGLSGEVTPTQAAACASLDFSDLNGNSAYAFSDVTGISYFTNLQTLISTDTNSKISKIDLSSNTKLVTCRINALASNLTLNSPTLANVSLLPAQTLASTTYNITINNSNSIASVRFDGSWDTITIDNCNFDATDGLLRLYQPSNFECEYLNISNSSSINSFEIWQSDGKASDIECLKIKNCPNLDTIWGYSGGSIYSPVYPIIEGVYITGSTKLSTINISGLCSDSVLTKMVDGGRVYLRDYTPSSIDLTGLPSLTDFFISDAPNLTSLDLGNNTKLSELSVNRCAKLSSVTLPATNSLNTLYVTNCKKLTSIDVGQLSNLWNLYLHGNSLTNLDVSNNTYLCNLYAYDNLITSLNVRGLPQLSHLDVSPMNNSGGTNVLATLFVNSTQSISGVTVGRSTEYVPSETRIVSDGGSSEITYDEIW